MSRPAMRIIKKQKQVSIEERYNSLYNRYCNSQFTFDCHRLIQKLVEKGKKEPHMEGVQLYKILMEIAKILMMNQLEILFLGATVQQIQWKIIDSCLNNYLDDFHGLNPKLKSDNYSKKMQLSLLLIAYIVKLYLNEEMSIFDSKMHKIVQRNYQKMYQQWVQKMKKNFKFSPKNMNKLFKQLDVVRIKKEEQLEEVNYNSKVQELFTKLVQYEPKDNNYQSKEQTPVEEEEQEEEAIVPEDIARRGSIRSIRSLAQRQSFKEIINKRQNSIYNIRQPSFFMRNSTDEFM